MKRIIYLLLLLPLFLGSCEKKPEADFSVNTVEPVVGQEILFNNHSHNASSFIWDFGDGYTSDERNPYHTFNSTGSFEVILTAVSDDGNESKSSLTLTVVIPTLLVIEVREWDNQNILVPNSSILLYSSLADWDTNDPKKSVMEGFTDASGVAVFANLDPYVYYADVYETTHDNWDFRNPINGIMYIRTPEVMPHQINWFIAWVDVVNHAKGQARDTRSMTIRKIERKVSIHAQPASGGTENWQELYSRRVNK